MLQDHRQTRIATGDKHVVAAGLNGSAKRVNKLLGCVPMARQPHGIPDRTRLRSSPLVHVGESNGDSSAVERAGDRDHHMGNGIK